MTIPYYSNFLLNPSSFVPALKELVHVDDLEYSDELLPHALLVLLSSHPEYPLHDG